MIDLEIEVTVPLTIKVNSYRRGNPRKGEGDELEFEAYLPGGQRVYNEDLALTNDDIDTLVWEQIDKAEAEGAA